MADHKYVVSKSSMVGEDPVIFSPDGNEHKAEVLARDSANDLVLLSFTGTLPYGVRSGSFDTTRLSVGDLGKFLFSYLPEKNIKQSVAGRNFFTLSARFIPGYFGANAVFKSGKVTLTRIQRNSPAERFGLVMGDAILSINGIPLRKPADYGAELNKYGPGEKIVLQGEREDSAFTEVVELAGRPQMTHPMNQFEGGKSERRDGFQTVFVHDARIRSYECGGPVFDADGRFRGINIARFSHTTTVAIPAVIIYSFLADNIKDWR